MAYSMSTLVHGSNYITSKLRYCLTPMGFLFKFVPDSRNKFRPVGLSLMVILSIIIVPTTMMVLNMLLLSNFNELGDNKVFADMIGESVFVSRLYKLFIAFRLFMSVSTLLITLAQHNNIANVIVQNKNYINEKEQTQQAKLSFTIFLLKTSCYCLCYLVLYKDLDPIELAKQFTLPLILTFALNMTFYAPIILTCYLGSSLGKHVENFSELYIDSMFDQYMGEIETEESSKRATQATESWQSEKSGRSCNCQCTYLMLLIGHVKRALINLGRLIRHICARLNSRKYPELPEMKMTKISSANKMKMSDSERLANSQLIRSRLRRTQVMLSELRDMVSDINKLSSPIILMHLIHETNLAILISTGSIQAKIYRSLNFLLVPTIASTLSLTIGVVYICTCMDNTASQLKLMINKMFDFIIMNHRESSLDSDLASTTNDRLMDLRMASSLKSGERIDEMEALSETWSQFQYTRKLANTIQFTMGGVLPVTRRLVLSILAHILSAVFIAIEIMSIIDTSVSVESRPTLETV